uniref:Copia protein n=1 Tax=Tanacetum cinerariifolium TaxID=118510 RepID=A0A6L2NWF7_TANCI|nr:copia protein [Tanacetum cinerariifolium]
MLKVLSQAWEKFFEIQHAQPEDTNELFQKLLEDLQIIRDELPEYINSLSWNYPTFYDNDEEHSIQYKEYLENSSNAIAPVLPTEEPEYSLSMGYEHLSTIPEMESDEVIKSSVKNLVQIPREYKVTSDNESECDMPVCEDSSTFDVSEILSNSNNDDTSSDDDAFKDIEYVEASELVSLDEENDVYQEEKKIDLEDILQIQDSSSLIPIFEKSNNSLSYSDTSLPEFETFSDHTEETRSGNTTAHANNSLPEYDSFCFEIEPDQGSLTNVVMKDISDNSTNDPLLEEVDLFLASEDSIPPGIKNFDYDSEGDIHFLKELICDDSIPFPENKSSNFDHHDDPSFPRRPPEPPDVEIFFDFEPNSGEVISVVMNNIDELNEDECFDPGGTDLVKITKKGSKLDKIKHEIVKNAQKPDPKIFLCSKSQDKSQIAKSKDLFCHFLNKAFKVFNSRTRIVEENLRIRFSESKPNVVGSGLDWLFDIDALTRTMNYEPIVAEKEDNVNSTKNVDTDGIVNTVSSTVNAARTNKVNAVGGKISIELPFDPKMSTLEDDSIFDFSSDNEDDGAVADMNNLDTTIQVSPILNMRIHKDHPLDQVIGDLQSATQTKKMSKNLEEDGKNLERAIGSKWVFKNKMDEKGIMIRNKARLVAQGYTQEEGIDYDEVFAPVVRIKAIRLFLAYASLKDFVVYRMDVKSVFLYGKIKKEVYVCQPLGFEDLDFPDRVYKVEKVLYGLHQALRALYETLSTYLLDNRFQRGEINKTLFIKRHKGDILLVQVYMDDIIFVSTNKKLCIAFERLMHEKFQKRTYIFLGITNKAEEG